MKDLLFLSEKVNNEIRKSNVPVHLLAVKFRLHPVTLSRLLNRRETVVRNDKRIVAIARHFGLKPDEAFDEFEIVAK